MPGLAVTSEPDSRIGRAVAPILLSGGIGALGNGTFAAIAFLYYLRVVHMAPVVIGTVLTGAGVASVVVSVPIGRLLERRNPVTVNIALLWAQAAAVLGIAISDAAPALSVFAATAMLSSKLKLAARAALIVRQAAPGDRVRLRAATRSVNNVGMGIGSAVAALCAAAGPGCYRPALVAAAVAYAAAVLPLMLLRPAAPASPAPSPAAAHRAESVLADRRYLMVAAAGGLLSMHYQFIQVGLPVWVGQSPTRAGWVVSAALCVNTAVVALAQMPLASRITTVGRACTATVLAGGCLFAAAALIAVAGCVATALCCATVLVAAGIYSVGEVLQASSAWELSFALAPDDRPIEYQSVFTSAITLGSVLGPLVVTRVLATAGDDGWLVLGAGTFALAMAHWAFRGYRRIDNERSASENR